MTPWKKSVGDSRVDCSRVMVIDTRKRLDQKACDSGWKT